MAVTTSSPRKSAVRRKAKAREALLKPRVEVVKGVRVTPFRHTVYELLRKVPTGKVTTYGHMAKALGSSARAVGQAMRHNPFAPEVPCHRVVASSLDIGGFDGSWGEECANVQRKKALLEGEGVQFEAYRVRDQSFLYTAEQLAQHVTAG